MKKKILFITHVGDPGGAEYKMFDFCIAFNNFAEVLYFQDGTLKEKLDSRNIKSKKLLISEKIVNIKKTDGILKIILSSPYIITSLYHFYKNCRQFEIIVCMSQKAFLISSLAKPFVRKPIIWFMNDLLSEEHFSKILIKILVIVSRFSADHIILNSQASYEAWIKSGGRRKNVSIIYPGTDFAHFEKHIKNKYAINQYRAKLTANEIPLIGMFGRITPWKGQDIFINALSYLPETYGVIVGDAFYGEKPYLTELLTTIKKLKLEDRIYFAGHQDDIPELMSACDIIVHCSKYPEPFGLVIVEGMASKKPVIASDAGGAQEIIQHNITGQLTPVNDPKTLAEAIKKYIDNPDWTKEIASNGHMYSKEKFSKSKMITDLEQIINKY